LIENIKEVWEDLELVERAGVTVLSLMVLTLVVLFILFPPLLLIVAVFAAGASIFVLAIIGIATVIDRI
jgi:hypothetical protein